MYRQVSIAAVAVLSGLLLGGCGAKPAVHDGLTQGMTSRPVAAGTADPPAATVTKLLVVVEENHSLTQMKNRMPYAFGLAKRYGYATRYDAIRHPSLPNYIAITGGRTYGIKDDGHPPRHRLRGRSVFGQALAHGRSAALYAQSMPGRCATDSSGPYAIRHNPWPYFIRERGSCGAYNVSMDEFGQDVAAGALPRVGMVVPDVKHDAHDGTLRKADAWFRSMMSQVFAGPDWRSGHLAIVLTADEDDGEHGNRVLTVVIHPSQRHHVVTQRLNHYSLTRLYDEVAQLPYLHRASTASSMAKAFGLPLP